MDEVQQEEYLPAQFHYKMFLERFSTFLAEMLHDCMYVIECKLSGKQEGPDIEDIATNLIDSYKEMRC